MHAVGGVAVQVCWPSCLSFSALNNMINAQTLVTADDQRILDHLLSPVDFMNVSEDLRRVFEAVTKRHLHRQVNGGRCQHEGRDGIVCSEQMHAHHERSLDWLYHIGSYRHANTASTRLRNIATYKEELRRCELVCVAHHFHEHHLRRQRARGH